MKSPSTLFVALFATLVQSSFGKIETVPAADPLPIADLAFAEIGDGASLEIELAPPGAATRPMQVTVVSEEGTTLLPESSAPGTFVLMDAPKGGLEVTATPDEADVSRVAPWTVAVYHGNFDHALERLQTRNAALDPTPPATPPATPLGVAQLESARKWLDFWLAREGATSHGTDGRPVSGDVVSAFALAEEMVACLEQNDDLLALGRGRQLPGRTTFTARNAGGEREVGFNYMLRIPAGEAEMGFPFLMIVHGMTAAPNIMGGLRPELEDAAARMGEFPFLTMAPVFNGSMREERGWSPDELAGLVETFINDFPVDRERVYISGFSAGGLGINRTVAYRPDLFAAFAPLCGRGDPEWALATAPVPVFLFHGDQDDAVPVYRSVRYYEALEAAGANPRLRIYEGMGHLVWDAVYRDPTFFRWLLGHSRKPDLDNAPASARQQRLRSTVLEVFPADPEHAEFVVWVDRAFTLGDLEGEDTVMREVTLSIEGAYPALPLRGDLLFRFPAGIKDAASPVQIGIRLKGPAELGEGFQLDSFDAVGPLAIMRYGESFDDVIEAVKTYRTLLPEDKRSSPGMIMELLFGDIRNGDRYAIRALASD